MSTCANFDSQGILPVVNIATKVSGLARQLAHAKVDYGVFRISRRATSRVNSASFTGLLR